MKKKEKPKKKAFETISATSEELQANLDEILSFAKEIRETFVGTNQLLTKLVERQTTLSHGLKAVERFGENTRKETLEVAAKSVEGKELLAATTESIQHTSNRKGWPMRT